MELDAPASAPGRLPIKRSPSFSLLETVTQMSVNSPLPAGLLPPRTPSFIVPDPATEPAEPDFTPSVHERRGSLQHPAHDQGDYEWLKKRLCNGEAATCLSLSGNWAVALTPQRVGEVIDYTVRDKVKIPGSSKYQLVALTGNFQYYVLGVYGDAKGRAVAFQPKLGIGKQNAGLRMLYVAFRGLRNRGATADEDEFPALDRDAFRNATPTRAHWLPDPAMRVHGGILDHHASVWAAGVNKLFTALVARIRRGFPIDEVLLIGLSMGGALAGPSRMQRARRARGHDSPHRMHALSRTGQKHCYACLHTLPTCHTDPKYSLSLRHSLCVPTPCRAHSLPRGPHPPRADTVHACALLWLDPMGE